MKTYIIVRILITRIYITYIIAVHLNRRKKQLNKYTYSVKAWKKKLYKTPFFNNYLEFKM